jgi:hypothetical protein
MSDSFEKQRTTLGEGLREQGWFIVSVGGLRGVHFCLDPLDLEV